MGNSSAFSFLLEDRSISENFCTSSPTLNCTSVLTQAPCKAVSTSAEDVTFPIHPGRLSGSPYKLSESWRESKEAACGLGLPGWLLLAKGYSSPWKASHWRADEGRLQFLRMCWYPDNVLCHLTHSLPWIAASAVFSAFLQASGERNSWLRLHVKIGWDLQTQTFGRWRNLTWVSMIGRSKHNAGSCSSKARGKLSEMWSSPCHSLCGASLVIPPLHIPRAVIW